jgi:hypothetical protein
MKHKNRRTHVPTTRSPTRLTDCTCSSSHTFTRFNRIAERARLWLPPLEDVISIRTDRDSASRLHILNRVLHVECSAHLNLISTQEHETHSPQAACGPTQFSNHTRCAAQNVPVLINFKFKMHVKWLLVYRCLILQLNNVEMRFMKFAFVRVCGKTD